MDSMHTLSLPSATVFGGTGGMVLTVGDGVILRLITVGVAGTARAGASAGVVGGGTRITIIRTIVIHTTTITQVGAADIIGDMIPIRAVG